MRKYLPAFILAAVLHVSCFAQNSPAAVTIYKRETPFTSIAIDDNGNVYAGSNGRGLWKFDQRTWKNWSGFGMAFSKSNLRQITTKGNDLWVASSGYVFFLGSGLEGNNNNFWGGVHKIDQRLPIKRTYYRGRPILGQTQQQGPPTRNILGICIDSTGTPWCAASYHDSTYYPAHLYYNSRYHYAPGAVGRFNGTNFSFITGPALPNPTGILIGIGNDYLWDSHSIGKRRTCRSIVQVGGEMWVGSDGYDQAAGNTITAGILRYDLAGNYIGKYDQNNTPVPFGLTNGDFGPWSLYKDAKGRVWAGMSGNKGIAVYDTDGWHYIGVPGIFSTLTIFRANSIAGSYTGEVYFGTNNGLLVYKGTGPYTANSSYTLYTTADGLSSNSVFGIAVGKDRTIWATTNEGVNKITTGDLNVYTLKSNADVDPPTGDDKHRRLIASYDSKKPQSELDKDTLFIAADGSKATVLKWSGSDSKDLEFRIFDGTRPNDPEQHGSFVIKDLDPVANDSVVVQYTHPAYVAEEFTAITEFNGKAVRLQLVNTAVNPEEIVLDIPLKIMLPPVLMLHGIWSAGKTWDAMKASLQNNGLYRYKAHEILTPSYESDREFIHNSKFIGGYAEQLIENCGNRRFSAGKVDVVAHSMGGILTRLYLQDANGAGTYKNNVHKLVTINTPHSGSPLANIVQNKDGTFRWLLKASGHNPYKGALNNLALGMPPITELLNGPGINKNKVPSHAIHSTEEVPQWAEDLNSDVEEFIKSNISLNPEPYFQSATGLPEQAADAVKSYLYSLKYYILKNTECPLEGPLNECLKKIFRGENDLVVSDESQRGGLTSAHTLFTGFHHLNILGALPIHYKVLDLFSKKSASDQFTMAGFNPVKLKWDAMLGTVLARPAQVDSIRIVTPAYGAFYNRGDSVTVTVRATGGIKRVLFAMGYESGLDAFGAKSPDSLFRFKVPANVVSEIYIKVFGFDDLGNEYTDSSYIQVNQPAGITLDSIRFARQNDNDIPLIPVEDSTSFRLYGFYSDSSVRNITFEPGVSFTTGGGGISNSSPGYAKGVLIGFDELRASYSGMTDTLIMEVVPRIIADTLSTVPVRFTSITAQYKTGKVSVHWSTARELNNSHFIVEYSADGRNFIGAGRVAATNASLGSRYQFGHTGFIAGKNYYRIKQVDIDGNSSYSPVVAIIISGTGQIKIYPNPAYSTLIIDAGNLQPGKHTIRIVNTMGQAVFTKSFVTVNNKTNVEVGKWPAGIYWVELFDDAHHRIITETFYKQ